MDITKQTLKFVDATSLRRLANFLGLETDGMSDDQVRRLVAWRLKKQRINSGWSWY